MYRKSIQQIFDSLLEGSELKHKTLGAIKVTSKTKRDDSFLLLCETESGEKKRLSLENLWTQELIEYDAIFEEKRDEDNPFELLTRPQRARYQSYEDLFAEMDSAAEEVFNPNYSHYFWHYTASSNALKILREGFRCRKTLEEDGRLSFDNYKKIRLSRETMDKDRHPEKLRQYCRFFLRPSTPAAGFFVANWVANNESPVLFAIDRLAINGKRPTLLIFGPAGDAGIGAFSWVDRALNSEDVLPKRSLWNFNWTTIYTNDPYHEPVKYWKALQSEFLVYEKLGPEYIRKIYFRCAADRDAFLANLPEDDSFRDICEVEPTYFIEHDLLRYM